MNYRHDWLFDDYFFSDEFTMKKRSMTKDVGIILEFLDDLLRLDYIDGNIKEFIKNLNEFFVSKLKAIYDATSISQLHDINWEPTFIVQNLRSYLVSGFYQNYKPIIYPDTHNLNSKVLELNRIIREKDFSLTSYESFENHKRLFRFYTSAREVEY